MLTDFDQKMEIFQNSKIKKQQETQIAKLTNQRIRKHQAQSGNQAQSENQAQSVNQAELDPLIKIIEQSERIKQQALQQAEQMQQQAQQMQQQAQQMQQQAQMQTASLLQQLQQTQLSRKR